MKKDLAKYVLVLFAAVAFTAGLSARQVPEGEAIRLDLAEAPLDQILESFAKIAGAELDVEPGIEGSVTMKATAPWPEIMENVCRTLALSCTVLDGDPPTLQVRRAPVAETRADPAQGDPEGIDMDLVGADLRQTLESFAAISGSSLRLPKDLEGKVTIHAKGFPWPALLGELARINGYKTVWEGNAAELVEMTEGEKKKELQLVNMSLKDARAKDLVGTFAQIGYFFGLDQIAIDFDESLAERTVTVELHQVNYIETLDILCSQMGCDWGFQYGDPVVLWIKSSDDAAVTAAAEVEAPADRIPAIRHAGAEPKELGFRFVPLASPAIEGNVRFSWASPVQVLAPSPGLQAILSWVPFDPRLSVVLPMVRRCGASGSSIRLYDPVVLPLREDLRFDADGATLELRARGGFAGYEPKTAVASCGPERQVPIDVLIRRAEAKSPRKAPERGFVLEGYVLVTPIDASRPAAAVIDLGTDEAGRAQIAVVRPDAERTGVEVERLVLEPEGSTSIRLGTEGQELEMVVGFRKPGEGSAVPRN